jgi:aarF domain-containing kinase
MLRAVSTNQALRASTLTSKRTISTFSRKCLVRVRIQKQMQQKQKQWFHQYQQMSTTSIGGSGSSSSSNGASSNNLKYSILGGLLISIGSGLKYMNDEVGGKEGLLRTLSFYSLAIPAYMKYRTHMILESDDETWDELDKETSAVGLLKLLDLGGFYIKSGQMCAANIGNAFPKIWQDTMSVLQDQCPHKPYHIVKQIIESEYNKPIDDIFQYFDPNPIGAASIGQVHRATLHNGHNVVVKVQYPEVERVFRGDVRTIKMFAQIAQPVHVPPLIEIEKQFMTEFDYVQEAKQMDRVRENLTKATTNKTKNNINVDVNVRVPKSYPNLCTSRILVMEELVGEKLADALRHDLERHAIRNGMTVDEFQQEEEKKIRQLKKRRIDKARPNCERI